MGAVILSIHQDFVQRCHFKLRPPFQQMTIEHIVYHKSAYLSMVFFALLKKFGIVFVLIRKVYYSLALLHCIIDSSLLQYAKLTMLIIMTKNRTMYTITRIGADRIFRTKNKVGNTDSK